MFGYVGEGTIENLTLDKIKVLNEGTYSGAIAGIVDGGIIRNNLVTGNSSVTAAHHAGAIIGCNSNATLENNYYAISVTTTTSTGSLMTYKQRGIGDAQGDLFEDNGAMLYNTYTVTLPVIGEGLGSISMEGEPYLQNGQDYTVVGGLPVWFDITTEDPNEILSVNVTNNVTKETIPVSAEDPEDGITPYTFTMPDADVTVAVNIGESVKYDLWVGDTQVTEINCSDILGDKNATQSNTASFQYFPSLNKLFITNSTDNKTIRTTNDEGLTIYLAPNSTNAVGDIVYTGNGDAPLTITTDGNYPGSISLSANADVISGFRRLTLEQNLVITKPDEIEYDSIGKRLVATYATIGVPLSPITENKTIEPDGNELQPEAGSGDVNKVVEDILYTLGNANNETGDGYDTDDNGDGFIAINSVTTDQEANDAARNFAPGTDEYLDRFKGLTFMVPAGSGTIRFDMQTLERHVLKVAIGDAVPVKVEQEEKGEVEIPYNVSEPTYVYAYNGGQIGNASGARGIQKGKKTTVYIKIYTVGINPKKVKSANPADQASGGEYEGNLSGLEGQEEESPAEKEARKGNVNGDETIDAADVAEVVNAIMGLHSGVYDRDAADVNGDGVVNAADIVMIVNKMMEQ